MNVVQLRANGCKVRVLHHRKYNLCGINCKGGKTVVQIRTPDGEELEGTAVCSAKENYNKKLGTSIAIGRALKLRALKSFTCRPTGWFLEKGGPCGLVKKS